MDMTQSYDSIPTELGTPPRDNRTDSIRNTTFLTEQQRETLTRSPASLGSPADPPSMPMQRSLINRTRTFTVDCDIFDVNISSLSGEEDTSVRVSCPKPSQLKVLLSELEINGDIPQSKCKIEYKYNLTNERIKIKSQKDLEAYLTLENRPQLFLSTD